MTWLILGLGILAALLGYQNAQQAPPQQRLVAKRSLLLVSLVRHGDDPLEVFNWALSSLEQIFDVEVELYSKPIILERNVFHHRSGQANAVALADLLERHVRPDRAVLGLTEYDLYSPVRRDLSFALGARKGWAGLISTYRMADPDESDNTLVRFEKMLVRYGAEILCDAPRESDPESVLFDKLEAPEQLDRMQLPQ